MLLHLFALFIPLGHATVHAALPAGSANAFPAIAVNAGFTEAVFDATTLNDVLADRDCVALRFYNSMPEGSSAGTVMVIGVRADGSELTGGLFARAYKGSAGLTDDRMIVDTYSRSGAGQACANMAAAGNASFSASFAKADVMTLLGQPGCNGIRVTPDEANGSTTMKLAAVTIARSAAQGLGAGPGFELVCGDPCPAFCGSPLSHYVNDALIPNR